MTGHVACGAESEHGMGCDSGSGGIFAFLPQSRGLELLTVCSVLYLLFVSFPSFVQYPPFLLKEILLINKDIQKSVVPCCLQRKENV